MDKIIFVPPPRHFTADVSNLTMNIGGDTCRPFRHERAEVGIYDPLKDYIAWYANGETTVYRLNIWSVIQNKVWALSDITDWLNANCTSKVLVQSRDAISPNGWNLHFVDANDHARFDKWLSNCLLTSFETIVLEEEGKKAVSDWLSAIEHRTVNYDMHRRTMTVRFRYDADAALFKLHWSRQIRT